MHQVGGELRGDVAIAVAGFIDQAEGIVADGLGRVAVAQGVVALGEGGGVRRTIAAAGSRGAGAGRG
ncbi:MAG: hypothetical protein ACLFTD_11020 [Halochromatium sp.]